MTFLQMYTRIITNSARSDQTTLAKNSINDVLGEITSQGTFKWMEDTDNFATVASTESYVIATVHSNAFAAYKNIVSMRQITSVPYSSLKYVGPEEYDNTIPYPAGDPEGKPLFFTEKAGSWYLYPIPDDAYTIEVLFYQKHPTLSGDSDVFICPDDWLPVVEDLSMIRFYRALGLYTQAGYVAGTPPRVLDRLNTLMARDKIRTSITQIRKRVKKNFPSGDYWLNPFYSRIR